MSEVEQRINEAFEHAKDSVNLSGQKLTTLPESISTLTNMNKLNLMSNQLTTLPESISTLTNLKWLHLSSNQFTTLPESISTLTNLNELNLTYNQLTTLPESISTLTNLNELYLSSNQLTTLPESILTLTNLKGLYHSRNQLTTLPESISTLTNLNELILSSNQLTTLPESISILTNLKWLHLSSNQLTTLPESISTLSNLIQLYLSRNQLTTLPESLSTLTNLNGLNLNENKLTTLPESISTLSNLKVLYLGSNQFTTLPESISTLTNLEVLNLNKNQFGILPQAVLKLSSAVSIAVEDNPFKFIPSSIVKTGVQAIKKYYDMIIDLKLPQKKIVVAGEGHVGKTSLVKRLKNVRFYSFRPSMRTEGVDIHSIEISKDKYISVWDFAGQEHFLSSHKLYFTKNSVFIVVVQLTDTIKVIKDQLSKWLFIIHQLCPDTQVVIVATKIDLISVKQLQEKVIQLGHVISSLNSEFEISVVQNSSSQTKHFVVSNEQPLTVSSITALLQELSKETMVHSFGSSVSLLRHIKSCNELCIGVKQLASLSGLPLQDCLQTLKHLEELGMIVYVESNADDEDATVILNGDLISKAFNKLKMKCRELTKSELTGWIDYNLAKSTVSPKIKFKMFIDVIEKAKLVYVDRQSDDETQWKIFIPHIVLDNNLKPLFEKDSASFSVGRLFYFKHQLPIGFFEHLAIQMQFFVKLASYSMMMSSFGIKIVGNASAVFVERIKLDGEFINAIRITSSVNNNDPKLFHEVIEAIEECLFAYFKNNHDVCKFVKRLVLCSCQHCQVKFKTNQLTKQQYLPLSQDDSIQEGMPSILTQYTRGQKTTGCIDSNATVPLTDLLFELQLLNDLPLIDYNAIKIHKREVRGKGGFGTVRVGVLSNGRRVAVKEINDVQAAFKEIKILRQVNHKHIVKVLGYSRHGSSACMFIVTELLDKSLSQLIAEMNGSLASDLCMLVRIALNITKGISYLHSQHPPVIHRDIKPDNIMFDESMNVKIIDFGIAKQAALPYLYERRGTPGYCAPEVIGQTKYNSAADVYSFGCVLFAMCGDMSNMHPSLEPFVTQLQTLIAKCRDKEPAKRPTALDCVKQLKTMLEAAKMLKEKHGDLFKSYTQNQLEQINNIVHVEPLSKKNWSVTAARNSFASKEELKRQLKAMSLKMRDNAGSGDCLPYSLIDYLNILIDFQGDCDELRQLIADYVRQNWRHLAETYPNNIGAIISNEDEANQWAAQYQQPQQWCDTVFACICACVFRLRVEIIAAIEHQALEQIMFEPVDADFSQPIIRIAYVNQNHFVSVWPDTGYEVNTNQ